MVHYFLFQMKLSIPGLGVNSIYQRKMRTIMLKMVSQLFIFFSVVGDDNTYGLICVSTLSFSLYFRFVLWSLLLTLSFLLYKKSLYYTLYIS